jgi:hypothetical protein
MPDRLEREIDEILKKLDSFLPEKGRQPRPARRPASRGSVGAWLGRRVTSISLSQVMLWALVIVLAAFLFRFVNPMVMRWVLIGGLIVFATAFVLSVFGGRRPRGVPEKRWRGQPLDLSGPGWPDRLKTWLRGRKKR